VRWYAQGGIKRDAPERVKAFSKKYLVEQDLFASFSGTGAARSRALLDGMSKAKLHDRLTRMGAFKNVDCCVDGVKHGRGFLKLTMVDVGL